jgi:hypothetical protein
MLPKSNRCRRHSRCRATFPPMRVLGLSSTLFSRSQLLFFRGMLNEKALRSSASSRLVFLRGRPSIGGARSARRFPRPCECPSIHKSSWRFVTRPSLGRSKANRHQAQSTDGTPSHRKSCAKYGPRHGKQQRPCDTRPSTEQRGPQLPEIRGSCAKSPPVSFSASESERLPGRQRT